VQTTVSSREEEDAGKKELVKQTIGTRAIDNVAYVEPLLSEDRKRERQRFEAAFITYNRCLSAQCHRTGFIKQIQFEKMSVRPRQI